MPGQQKIEATYKEAGQRSARAAREFSRFIAWRQIERVMRYHDLPDATGQPAEMFFHPEHLPVIDTAAFDDESPGGIDAGNGDFVIEVEGLQVIGDILLIGIEGPTKPRINVVQGDVMISRHHYLRRWKRAQERTRSFELTWRGSLRQVAGNGDYVRLELANRVNQLLDDSVISPAEVEIGKMD